MAHGSGQVGLGTADGSMLRLLEFEVAIDDGTIESLLKVTIVPGPGVVAGLLRTLVGRRTTGSSLRYLVATVWADRDAMMTAVRDGVVAVYQPSFAPYLGNAAVAALGVDAGWWSCEPELVAMLRVFREIDLATEAASTVIGVADASSWPDGPGGRPCLVLSTEQAVERVILAGWPRPESAGKAPVPLGVAVTLLARVDAMLHAGLGIEYEVVIDHAAGPRN